LNKNNNIIFLGYRTDSDLETYYRNALFFIYVPFYEGFGLPPIEAMSFGCPVIVSNRASLPEVCGDAALYCDPDNIDEIVQQQQLLLNNSALSLTMIDKGKLRASTFSWEYSVNKLGELINNYL